jgi:hypothetical protein
MKLLPDNTDMVIPYLELQTRLMAFGLSCRITNEKLGEIKLVLSDGTPCVINEFKDLDELVMLILDIILPFNVRKRYNDFDDIKIDFPFVQDSFKYDDVQIRSYLQTDNNIGIRFYDGEYVIFRERPQTLYVFVLGLYMFKSAKYFDNSRYFRLGRNLSGVLYYMDNGIPIAYDILKSYNLMNAIADKLFPSASNDLEVQEKLVLRKKSVKPLISFSRKLDI